MTLSQHDWLKTYITDVPDFPKEGIIFKDINPLLANHKAFQYSIQKLSEMAWRLNAEAIVAIESRGFIFGAAMAFSLGVPFVPIRKKGKLPGRTEYVKYELEYASGELEIPKEALVRNSKVVIIDDVLATGGTAKAAIDLLKKIEVQVSGFLCLIELDFLQGRALLEDTAVEPLINYT